MNELLEQTEYLNMSIMFKSSYGYMIQKEINQLTEKERKYLYLHQYEDVQYIGHVNSLNKYNGRGFIFQNGKLHCYSHFVNGKKDGTTVEYMENNISFRGMYKDGKRNGYGELFEKNENGEYRIVFEGNFEDNKYSGMGKFFPDDELCYVGNFEKNKLHGENVKIYNIKTGNCIFQGTFNMNKIEGFGKYFMYNDDNVLCSQYEGNYLNSKWDGKGVLKTMDTIYEGEFKKGELLRGKEISFGKLKYDGSFKNFKYHGHGSLIDNEDTIYVGEFRENMKHGEGVLMKWDSLDILYEGKFENNHMKMTSTEYINNEFQIKKMLEQNEENTLVTTKNLKKKHIMKFMSNRKIPYKKRTTKKQLLERIQQFHWIDKKLLYNSSRSIQQIKKEHLVDYIKTNLKKTTKTKQKTKGELFQILLENENLKKEQEINHDDDFYDFFGNEIKDPVLGNDGIIYDKLSCIELKERNMEPVLFNGIPLKSFYTYDELADEPEKQKLFDNYRKHTHANAHHLIPSNV